MRKSLLITWYEFITTITRRSFLFAAIGVPLISTLIVLGISAINQRSPGAVSNLVGASNQGGEQTGVPEGFVDLSGIIKGIPASIPASALRQFTDVAAARQALEKNEISNYYLIPADYLATGQIINVRPDFSPFTAFEGGWALRWTLHANVLGGDERLTGMVQYPLNLDVTVLDAGSLHDPDSPMAFIIPYAITFIYYLVIMMSASLLLNSVSSEKESRVIEILLSTVTPRELLSGKMLGLGMAGLLQTGLWIGTVYSLLRLGGDSFNLPASFQLPISFLVIGIAFFLLGYALYASLMAAIGALVPHLREASQASFAVLVPLLLPMMAISIFIEDPNGAVATFFSLFPLTSPVAMITRQAVTQVPAWQTGLSMVLLALTGLGVLQVVAGLFRAQTLLSGSELSWGRVWKAIRGGAEG